MQNTAKKAALKTSDRFVKPRSSLKYQAGFGLIELLITLLLISILFIIATPSIEHLKQYYERVKLERITQQLLQEARSTAFSLRQRIIVCGSRQPHRCDSSDWRYGILMFHDQNLDNLFTPDVDVVLRFEPLDLRYGTLQWIGGSSFRDFVRFEQTSGMPHASFGSFHYCDFEHKHLFKMVMRNTGVLRKDNKDVRC